MEANLYNLFYLFFRLSPFIIACFFSLISLFNSDIKGLIYLVGLVFGISVTWLFGRGLITEDTLKNLNITFPNNDISDEPGEPIETKGIPDVCNFLSLGGFQKFSKVPLSLAVLCFTFFYLVYTIAYYHMEVYNIPTLIMFPILILADVWWNVTNNCFPFISCLVSIIVASGIGVLWSYIVQQNMPNYQYLIVGSNRQLCMKPSDQQLICTETTTS